MEIFYPVDTVMNAGALGEVFVSDKGTLFSTFTDAAPRLPVADIAELNAQLNVNMCDVSGSDGDSDTWFDADEYPADIQIVDTDEFFERFCS